MSSGLKRILVVGVVIVLLATAVWYWSRPQPIPVTLATAERGAVEETVTNTRAGTLQACRRARLSPASGGQIARLPVREGDRVQRNDILLELWNEDLAAELMLARREAAAAEARAEQACVTAAVQEREANRLSQLRKQGLASEEAAERAVGTARAAQAACKAAKVSTEVSQARVKVTQAALERTVLRAPFDGTVANLNGELGEFVTPSPIGVPTPPAVDLIDTNCLYVLAPIDEVDAPRIQEGDPARITLDAFPQQRFPGRVRRIAPYVTDVEQQARTVDIEVSFVDPPTDQNLLLGYSADAEVILAREDKVLRIPTPALREGNQVLVYDPQTGTVEQREIKTGVSNWVYTEVESGLEPGDQVVTSVDREGIQPGSRVVPETAR